MFYRFNGTGHPGKVCGMNKHERLTVGCTFFIGGTMLYCLTSLTQEGGIPYLLGYGLPALGLILMYLGVRESPER